MSGTAEDLRVLVIWLRGLARRTQTQMAAIVGVKKVTLSRLETGRIQPDRRTLERLADEAGVPCWIMDTVLLPVIRHCRVLLNQTQAPFAGATTFEAVEAMFARAPSAHAVAAMAEFLAGDETGDLRSDPTQGPGQDDLTVPAAATGQPFQGETLAQQAGIAPPLLEPSYRESLIERLCEESARAASDDPDSALVFARAALWIAWSAAEDDPGQRSRQAGYSWAFVANAQRVGGDLLAAAASFAAAWRLWCAAPGVLGSSLAEWRILDLDASLFRDRRLFAEALARLDAALALAPPEAKGRILINKSSIYEQAGQFAEAAVTLDEALPLIRAAADPRLHFAAQFNRLVVLCHIGRHAEAAIELKALRTLTEKLGNALDLLRLRWLEGRVALYGGRREDARSAFEEVRHGFAQREIAYCCALVSIELAVIHLEDGRTAAARALANEMLWIFRAQRVPREAIVALNLFCDAAANDVLTPALARRVLADLENAKARIESA